jgi:hypothetical protein
MPADDISRLIAAWSRGDEDALRQVIPLVYPELRRIARLHLGRRPAGHTLESAALAKRGLSEASARRRHPL